MVKGELYLRNNSLLECLITQDNVRKGACEQAI